MPNLHDYLLWRGDLPVNAVPLCEVDDLLLAQLSYVSFDGIVPGLDQIEKSVPLESAAADLLTTDPDGKTIKQIFYMWKDNRRMLEALMPSVRYGAMGLWGYHEVEAEDTQFAAFAMRPTPGVTVIGYRGTDASIAGWKEDGMLALDAPVNAQLISVEYLHRIAEATTDDIYLTGHSKGGNLAVYAAACARPDVQARIKSIATCDGPGFSRQLLASDGYQNIRDKLRIYIPQSSVVGMLLEHEDEHEIIHSNAIGLLQHDAFSWQIEGPRLIRASGLTSSSAYLNRVLRDWLDGLSNQQREEFVTSLFTLIEELEIQQLDDINARVLARIPGIIWRMHTVDRENKAQLTKSLRKLGSTAFHALLHPDN